MAEALAVLIRLLVVSTIVERFLEIASQLWDLILHTKGLQRADPGRKRVILQTAGVMLGTALSLVMGVAVFRMLGIEGVPLALDILFTGILVGSGTEPVHSLIKFLEENKERVKRELATAKTPPETVRVEPKAVGISYRGGLYPDRPGHGKRRANPTMIVYHHSGTSIDATFERIVQIEKERELDPTYHCVVTKDGKYHNYCRWDSIGWHAKGVNAKSLGICVVGNFHTDPASPDSNADGRFGPKRPTEAQMDTAARVIALWMLLYDIPPDQIIPHRAVRNTDCPGDNFPSEELVQRAIAYRDAWSQSEEALAEIRDFREKEGVYV